MAGWGGQDGVEDEAAAALEESRATSSCSGRCSHAASASSSRTLQHCGRGRPSLHTKRTRGGEGADLAPER
jgi:hypothetical protein